MLPQVCLIELIVVLRYGICKRTFGSWRPVQNPEVPPQAASQSIQRFSACLRPLEADCGCAVCSRTLYLAPLSPAAEGGMQVGCRHDVLQLHQGALHALGSDIEHSPDCNSMLAGAS